MSSMSIIFDMEAFLTIGHRVEVVLETKSQRGEEEKTGPECRQLTIQNNQRFISLTGIM